MRNLRLIFVTGLSGSGKSLAIKYIEDLGFFCVDNLPSGLIPKFIELFDTTGGEISRVAIGVDIRERSFLSSFPDIFTQLKKAGGQVDMIFLEASDEVLIRRFSESRRPHPLARDVSVAEAIRQERKELEEIRGMADLVLETSRFTVHDLKRFLVAHFEEAPLARKLSISLTSFGFKYGIPFDSDLLFDVRFLPNPHFVAHLREGTGLMQEVADYIGKSSDYRDFMDKLNDLLLYLIPRYEKEGKSYLSIAVGCTGGRHRSVRVAQAVGNLLESKSYRVTINHRDIEK